MEPKVNLGKIYKPSEDVVARDVQGEFIIIPITSGIGDSEDEIYSLNETGVGIWNKLDGKRTLKEIGNELAKEYEIPVEDIEKDVLGIVEELLNKKILSRVC